MALVQRIWGSSMNMSDISTLARAAGLTVFDGYAKTGSVPPYVVNRPMIISPEELVLCGQATSWDFNFGLYCVGGSVEASYNLAVSLMQALQGKRVGSSTLACSMGYVGAQVESRYETQVTVQINQGALA